MTAIRRGKVTTPHKNSDSILLTRCDASKIRIPIERILYWEDVTMNGSLARMVIVHHDLSATAVKESFEAIDAEVNGKAVQS